MHAVGKHSQRKIIKPVASQPRNCRNMAAVASGAMPNDPLQEDVEAAVRSVLCSCVEAVAARTFIEQHLSLVYELEELQIREWAAAEQRHKQRYPPVRILGAPVPVLQQQQQQARCSRQQRVREAVINTDGSKTRRRQPMPQKDDGAELSVLHKRMHAISVVGLSGNTIKAALPAGSSGATSGTASTSRRARKHSATPLTPCASGFASCAESLLPASPNRSQFAFEVENVLLMHAASDEDRQIQRRLSMLSALQQETIKLERRMRAEAMQPSRPCMSTQPFMLRASP